jgi:hypothetical protein
MSLPELVTFLTSTQGIMYTMGSTAALAIAGNFLFSAVAETSADEIPTESRQFAEKKCSLATYEFSSTTQEELRKLRASPAFQKWHAENLEALAARQQLEENHITWLRTALFVVLLFALFVLPCGSFADSSSPSVSDLLAQQENDLAKAVAALSVCVLCLATLRGSGSNAASASVLALWILAWLTEGVATIGPGFLLMLVCAAANCFFL